MKQGWRIAVCGTLAALFAAVSLTPVDAGILTKILKEAGESAGDAGKKAGKGVDGDVLPTAAPQVFKDLPESEKGRSLVAAPTPEGHLRLVNPAGEQVTAANAAELAAALKWLLPKASDLGRRHAQIYVDASVLNANRDALNLLPPKSRLHVMAKSKTYPVLGSPPFKAGAMHVQLRENLVVKAADADVLNEAIWQTGRPVNHASLRVLTLDPDTSSALPRLRATVDGQAPPTEAVNPYALARELKNLRGQTALLAGKIDGDFLYFTPPSGKTQSVLLSDIRKAALQDDVNLIVLNTDTARQPGVRNMLWQKTEVDGLADALTKATLGDFWAALAGNREPLELSLSPNGTSHIAVKAEPNPSLARGLPDEDGSLLTTTERIFTEIVSTVTSNVVTSGIEASLRSEAHDKELKSRIIPGIPSDYQILYLCAFVVGLIGLPTITRWWRKLWPLTPRATFTSTLGLIFNRLLRVFPFFFLFMPLVAPIATPYQILMRPLELITAPFRWLFAQFRPARA